MNAVPVKLLKEERGIDVTRDDIKVNVFGVNHFTWLDKVTYMGEDLIPLYKEAIDKNSPVFDCAVDDNWINNVFATDHSVKRDLFKRNADNDWVPNCDVFHLGRTGEYFGGVISVLKSRAPAIAR